MSFRLTLIVTSVAVLAACAPQVPDSGRGVGLDTSFGAGLSRDAALETSIIRVPDTVVPPAGGTGAPAPVTGIAPVAGSAEATAAETTRILAATRPVADGAALNSGVTPLQADPNNPPPNNVGISNENNFDAVSDQRSIDADAARIAQNRAQYQVVQPQALPDREGDAQPNIVAFALSTRHPVGTRVYSRAGLNGAARAERNCAKYSSPDQAQIDFLSRGGPERDRRGLDPDGDGYACAWNPTPFRKASQGG
ncbi:MAG: hypothetical protein AB8B47_05840 [Roseobacter sp.]